MPDKVAHPKAKGNAKHCNWDTKHESKMRPEINRCVIFTCFKRPKIHIPHPKHIRFYTHVLQDVRPHQGHRGDGSHNIVNTCTTYL